MCSEICFSFLLFHFSLTVLRGGSGPIFAPSSDEGILSGLGICTPAAHFLVNLCALKERLRLLFVARSSHHLAYELCSPVYSSWSSPVFQLSAWSLYPVSQSSLLCSSKMCRIHRLHGPVSPLESTLHSVEYFSAFRNLTCLTAPLIDPQSTRLLLTSSVL